MANDMTVKEVEALVREVDRLTAGMTKRMQERAAYSRAKAISAAENVAFQAKQIIHRLKQPDPTSAGEIAPELLFEMNRHIIQLDERMDFLFQLNANIEPWKGE